MQVSKHYGKRNTGQIIQVLFIPAYLWVIPYIIFELKGHYHLWGHGLNVTWVRVWLLVEIIFFFNWIIFSSCFVSYSYIFKLRSFSKNVEILALDDNVWNDTGTEDFLKFLKFEYFFLTYFMSLLGTQCIIGFSNMYYAHKFGDRPWNPVGWIMLLLVITKVN